MKFKIESNSIRGLLLNISLAVGLFLLLSIYFFYKFLPRLTNKDQVVTVPDLNGMSFEYAKKFLETRELSYEVTDSAYNSEMPPLAIVEQYPRPFSKVKIERKINLKLNARKAPLVPFPDLTGSTFDFAQKQLRALDFKMGTITYRPDIAANSILASLFRGNKISDKQRIPKGSKIDLVIGSSTAGSFALPDFIGMEYDEVELYLLGLNLHIGEINSVIDDRMGTNIIQKQNPVAGDSVSHFDTVDLWVFNLKK